MDVSNITIETERLLLAPTSTVYAEEIFKAYCPPITKWMHHASTGSFEELKERLKKWEEEITQSDKLFMVALLKESKEFLGSFTLGNINTKKLELGGWIKESAQGSGYGREAAAALKQWADENLEYEYISWPCAKENAASRKLIESLGGKVHREYEKKTPDGREWVALEYRIVNS